jgi:predicted dinucleotide-binding enzyme
MNVGILGSGDVARALGTGFLRHGHAVMLGTREPYKLEDWVSRDPNARVGHFADAAQFGELLVLAVKGAAAAEALRAAGAANLAEKTVIDATNPLTDDPPANGVHSYFTSLDESLLERLQREFPDARFVKAFNQVNNSRMVNPQFGGIRPTMFICGNDAAAKETVTRILDQFGWETEDMGQVEAARSIEPLCMLWAIRYHLRKKWDHAFKLLKSE